jgi:hypothetical protein
MQLVGVFIGSVMEMFAHKTRQKKISFIIHKQSSDFILVHIKHEITVQIEAAD